MSRTLHRVSILALCVLLSGLGCGRTDEVIVQAQAKRAAEERAEADVSTVVQEFLAAVRAEEWETAAEFFCTRFRQAHRAELLSGELLRSGGNERRTPACVLRCDRHHIAKIRVGQRQRAAWAEVSGWEDAPRGWGGGVILELLREGDQWRVLRVPLELYWPRPPPSAGRATLPPTPQKSEAVDTPPGPGTSPLGCPSISRNQYPALVFIEGKGLRPHLYVAHFAGGTAHRQEILCARSIYVYRLGETMFLIRAAAEPEGTNVFVVDLHSGLMKLVAQTPRFHLLRSEPDRNKAMLIRFERGMPEIDLVELDLSSLKTTLRHTIKGKLLREKFSGLGPRMKLSPDFKHIAFVSLRDQPGVRRESQYALRLLDLGVMKASDLDPHVRVEISGISSHAMGSPPFEWISDHQIIYQHVIPSRTQKPGYGMNCVHVLKVVDIDTGTTWECLRADLRLTLDGGNLAANPLNGRIVYRDRWLVDVDKGVLTPKDGSFFVERGYQMHRTMLFDGDRVLHSGKDDLVHDLISASQKHFAYSLRPHSAAPNLLVRLYVKLDGVPDPIQVAEGPYLPTQPIAWIEDTRPLRQRSKD